MRLPTSEIDSDLWNKLDASYVLGVDHSHLQRGKGLWATNVDTWVIKSAEEDYSLRVVKHAPAKRLGSIVTPPPSLLVFTSHFHTATEVDMSTRSNLRLEFDPSHKHVNLTGRFLEASAEPGQLPEREAWQLVANDRIHPQKLLETLKNTLDSVGLATVEPIAA